jgi:hypothetical protein
VSGHLVGLSSTGRSSWAGSKRGLRYLERRKRKSGVLNELT